MPTVKQADSNDMLSVSEAAAVAGVSKYTLRRWDAAGRIASVRTPTGHRRFRRSDVERLLQPAVGPVAS